MEDKIEWRDNDFFDFKIPYHIQLMNANGDIVQESVRDILDLDHYSSSKYEEFMKTSENRDNTNEIFSNLEESREDENFNLDTYNFFLIQSLLYCGLMPLGLLTAAALITTDKLWISALLGLGTSLPLATFLTLITEGSKKEENTITLYGKEYDKCSAYLGIIIGIIIASRILFTIAYLASGETSYFDTIKKSVSIITQIILIKKGIIYLIYKEKAPEIVNLTDGLTYFSALGFLGASSGLFIGIRKKTNYYAVMFTYAYSFIAALMWLTTLTTYFLLRLV